MRQAVIVSATRTAVGTMAGTFASTTATELGAHAVREAIRRAGIEPGEVDEVILGNVLQAGLGLNPARIAALAAGVPQGVGSYTINKACGSGLKAVALAASSIMCGEADAIVAGGMENMSLAPYFLRKARYGYRLGNDQLFDHMIADGLNCPITLVHMGVTAENIAAKYGISRKEQDEFAAESQARYFAAMRAGKFKAEIVPVEVQRGKETVQFQVDEHPRETKADQIAGLKPAFKKDGSVTAANASGINDGASAVVLASAAFAQAHGLPVLARVTAYATGGGEPRDLFFAPIQAVRNLMAKAGTAIGDYEVIEANEAFAVQALADGRGLGWDWDRVNVNGGAVALGHPIGASGARVLTTLLYAMQQRQAATGLATLCLGGGNAVALSVERAA